jgi:hypothetical protein
LAITSLVSIAEVNCDNFLVKGVYTGGPAFLNRGRTFEKFFEVRDAVAVSNTPVLTESLFFPFGPAFFCIITEVNLNRLHRGVAVPLIVTRFVSVCKVSPTPVLAVTAPDCAFTVGVLSWEVALPIES